MHVYVRVYVMCLETEYLVSPIVRTYLPALTDPAVVQKREEALLAARERMQTLAARNSIIAEERRREVEEEKQRTKAEEWEHHRMFGEGLNNKSSQVDQKPVSLK